MGRSTYTDEVKARAVALYLEHGPAEAARRLEAEGTKIPQGTIRAWASHGDVATERHATNLSAVECARAAREAKREQLRNLLIDKAVDMLERMDHMHYDYRGKDAKRVEFDRAPSGACQQYATSAAILVDKFRLEMGESTGRTEHTVSKEAAHAAVDELAARRAKHAA